MRSSSAFVKWAAERHVAFPGLGFDDLPCFGRSVVVTNLGIAAGDVIITVPDDIVLLVENCCIAEQLDEAGLSHGECSALIESYALALALLAERAVGAASRWHGYIQALPPALPGLPINWDPSELEALSGTSVLQHLLGTHLLPDCENVQRSEPPCGFDLLWQQVILPFIAEHHDSLGLPAKNPNAWHSAYAWALSIVSAYAFTLGDDQFQGLVPMWDMLNHVTGQVNVRLHHDQAAGALQMIATQDIAPGAQVVNNFGALSPAELLLHYGFVEVNGVINPHNHTNVALADLLDAAFSLHSSSRAAPHGVGHNEEEPPWADVARPRFRFLVKHGFMQPNGCCRVVQDTQVSMRQLLECARVACLATADFAVFEKRVTHWRVPQAPPLSGGVPCAAAALAVARTVVQRRLKTLQSHADTVKSTHCHDDGVNAAQGLTVAARATAAAMVVKHERALLEPLCALLEAADKDTAAAACEAAWSRIL